MSICVIRGTNPNEIYPESKLKGKKIKEISQILSLNDSFYISYHSPIFQKRLELSNVPLHDYPELVLEKRPEKYPPPEHYLCVLPAEDDSDLHLYFNVKTQMKTEFPKMCVPFKNSEIKTMKISDVLNRAVEIFGYDCSNGKILFGDSEVENSKSAKDIIDKSVKKREPITFECEVSEGPQKKINHRIFNTTQIITSEQSYINDLNEIITFWEPEFRKANLFSEDEHRTLFRDVATIKASHSVFLESLPKSPEDVTFATEIGTKFLSFAQFFKVSGTFVSQFKQMDEMIKTKSKSGSFKAKMKEIESKNETGRDFLSYYVTPVQRYPRYPLLIRDLDKVTPNFHPDKPYLDAALVELDKVNNTIDQNSYTMKTLEIMDTLQKDFGFGIVINDPQRQLKFMTGIKTNRPKVSNGTIFLFNDMVVVASQPKKTYNYVFHSMISKFRFQNNIPNPEHIKFYYENRDYDIHFLNIEEKAVFIREYHQYFSNFVSLMKRKSQNKVPFIIWFDISIENDQLPQLMHHSGCYCKDNIYFFGGLNSSMSTSNTLICYNVETGETTLTSSLPKARESHTTTSINGCAYIAFGSSKKEVLNDIWKYDEINRSGWLQVNPTGEPVIPRTGHSSAAHGETIIFFGGIDKNGNYLNDVSFYDTKSNNYKRLVNLPNSPAPRAYHSACIIDNIMYIFGGRSEHGLCDDLCGFDISKKKWQTRSDVPFLNFQFENKELQNWVVVDDLNPNVLLQRQGRMHHYMFAIHDRYIVIIGGTSQKSTPLLEIIDTFSWKILNLDDMLYGNMPFGCSKFAAVKYKHSKILIYGGEDTSAKNPNNLLYKLDLKHVEDGALTKEEIIKANNEAIAAAKANIEIVSVDEKKEDEKENKEDKEDEKEKEDKKEKEKEDKKEKEKEEKDKKEKEKKDKKEEKEEKKEKFKLFKDKKKDKDKDKKDKKEDEKEKKDKKDKKEEFVSDKKELPKASLSPPSDSRKGSDPLISVNPSLIAQAYQDMARAKRMSDAHVMVGMAPKGPVRRGTFSIPKSQLPPTNDKVAKESSDAISQLSKSPIPKPQPIPVMPVEIPTLRRLKSVNQPNSNKDEKVVIPKGPYVLPTKYNLAEIYKAVYVDPSQLSQYESVVSQRKAKKLWEMSQENKKMQEKVADLELQSKKKFTIKPDTPVLVKVTDDMAQNTKMFRANSSDTVLDFTKKIASVIGRKNAILTIVIKGDLKEDLNQDSLDDAYREICKGRVKCLKIIAL